MKPTIKNKSSINETLKQLKKIMNKYFIKDFVGSYAKYGTAWCPLGMFIHIEDDLWFFSVEYNWIEPIEEMTVDYFMILQYMLKDVIKIIPNLEFSSGDYCIFDDDGNYVGNLQNDDILKHMKENELEYSVAKQILTQKLILEFEEKVDSSKS